MHLPERRFDETEVAAIFERATAQQEPERRMVRAGEGLTLGQLQEIGREIGIEPGAIADAVDRLDGRAPDATRRFAGLPIGVERTVRLGRRITDEEWERLVVELREIFDARGVVRGEGSLRQWTNGNLQALLELTDGAQRIRLRTVKGSALGRMAVGATMLGTSATALTSAALQGAAADAGMITSFTVLGVAGAALLGGTMLRLIPWARRRREQMAEFADRAAALARRHSPGIASPPAGPAASG